MTSTHRFEVYRDRIGEYRWRLKAKNGETIADSGEGYSRRSSAKRAIGRLCRIVRLGGYDVTEVEGLPQRLRDKPRR